MMSSKLKKICGVEFSLHRFVKVKASLSILLVFLCVSIVVSIKYYFRIYYSNSLLLDISPNFFTAIALPIIFYLLESNQKIKVYLIRSLILISLYEFSQIFDLNAVFDWFDIIASVLGVLFSIWILCKLNCGI